jgi:hypothetical protein
MNKHRVWTVGALVALLVGLLVIPSTAQTLIYDSCFQIQNLSATQASVTIDYYAQGNATPVASPSDTIPANGSKTYCPLSAVSSGFNGSVVISSDQPVAAIANVTGASWGAFNASYAGFSGGATSVNVPLLMKGNYGYNTWFNVQNVGGGTASVTVNYSDGTNKAASIPPNTAYTFDQSNETHSKTTFAATVTSNEPVVVTVMEVGPAMLFGYDGFTSGSPDPVMPLVQANNYGYTTGIQVQNTGGSQTTVTLTYTPSSAGSSCTQTKSIPAGGSETFAIQAWAPSDGNADNNCPNGGTFVGSAQVTTNSGGGDLVAIVNQQNFGANKGAAYGAFSPASASAKVVMPLINDRNYGYFTGFNVVNVGSQTTTVNCTFSNSTYTTGATLTSGAAFTAVQANQIGNAYVGSAVCTATGGDQSIIGVVNQVNTSGSSDTFLVYEAFNVSP